MTTSNPANLREPANRADFEAIARRAERCIETVACSYLALPIPPPCRAAIADAAVALGFVPPPAPAPVCDAFASSVTRPPTGESERVHASPTRCDGGGR